ncbi:L,D-transpeptidase family protein [Sulfurimonas diazotrophicus]|uniref:L,D-transpeptidase family protein n=1 Tax=Sulfurimonas diazotrophicus TaxID=3131939 RepID=A0ABZ3HAG3_9BACT
MSTVLKACLLIGTQVVALETAEEANRTQPVPVAAGPVAALIRSVADENATAKPEMPALAPAAKRFYAERGFAPFWSRDSRLLPGADTLWLMIDGIADEGLDPYTPSYHLSRIQSLRQEEGNETLQLAQLDVLLTDAFFALGHDLHYGHAYGADLNATHEFDNSLLEPAALLSEHVAQGGVQDVLLSVAPNHIGYQRLRTALAEYRRIADAGGWSTHAADYADDANVYRRLAMTGDLVDPPSEDEAEETERLRDAVKRFQRRHGITADGIVGPVTSAKMAQSPSALMKKIRLNMERWKWLPPHNGGPYIIVNIPGFTLEVMQDDEPLLTMQAIVGRRERETPTFASMMRYIVLNPYWRVPVTILNEDLIPKLQTDPHYLAVKHIKIFAADDTDESHPIDPMTIDWRQWRESDTSRYTFREDPGAKNPLGYVKFLFQNPYDIYIHDTPSQSLFKNGNGTFSSGCIRVRKPMELAHYLLALDDPDITYKALLTQLLTGENRWVRLARPVPVYITYQTARVDEEGVVYFYNDIYKYDRKLSHYLKKY